MSAFIGRDRELELLWLQSRQESSRIAVINGRRRVGKSELVREFVKRYRLPFFEFTGVSPMEPGAEYAQTQIDRFMLKLSKKTGKTYKKCTMWLEVFFELSKEISSTEKTVIFLDEISWMAQGHVPFIGDLKIWWDTDISHEKNVLLILCGSVSTWIHKNVLNSTALYGRISLNIQLQPLSMAESRTLLKQRGIKCSTYDLLSILAVTGGVPWYLEQINPDLSVNKNIKELCFKRGGLLQVEFDKIFNDVFSRYGDIYHNILTELSNGTRTLEQIRKAIGYSSGGKLGDLMDNLEICGFIAKHPLWSFQSKRLSRFCLYRISDPYIRFYFRCILPAKNAGNEGLPENFESIIGLQVETLLIWNRSALIESLKILPEEVARDGPYLQRATKKRRGCQVDYLVQTKGYTLYMCEIKCLSEKIGMKIIDEVREKIRRINIPQNAALVPVLYHMGPVDNDVYTSQFFYKIIKIPSMFDSEDLEM